MADSVTFFEESPEPAGFAKTKEEIRSFIDFQSRRNYPIVLVTSGGTIVPLEGSTVRFIDNFSIGTRGSASAEYFVEQGYAVLFLHRRGSLEPFTRHLPSSRLLDTLEISSDGSTETLKVKDEYKERLTSVLEKYQAVRGDNCLLSIEFTTVTDYLHLLRACATLLTRVGNQALLYLAAAVSDFYIPRDKMPQHKIQSSEGALQLSLELVPKMLEALVKHWTKDGFVVSFKLETDPTLLIKKARLAMEKYQHQIVIGNILETRKREVVMVTTGGEEWIRMDEKELSAGVEIETKIVAELAARHKTFYKDNMHVHVKSSS